MPGRGARLEPAPAELDRVLVGQVAVRALGAALPGDRDAAAQALAQQPGGGDVVGVHVRLERPAQLEAQLLDERRVAPRLLEHRVDQQRLAAGGVGEQIGVSRGLRVEQLAKNHRGSRAQRRLYADFARIAPRPGA